jgi:hypothetical protein
MGFSTDTAGGTAETLWIGGGTSQTQSSFTLAKLDTTTLTATPVTTHPALPEMTGNGNAELWGYFPDATTPRVVRFDKTTGAVAQTYPLPALAAANPAYAFAHWGGDYWVFLMRTGEPSTTVYQVSGANGTIKSMTPTTPRSSRSPTTSVAS